MKQKLNSEFEALCPCCQATLVIDPGMGRRSGEAVMREVAKVSRNKTIYIVNTHFHPEHTTGEMAFPADAKVIRADAQQQGRRDLQSAQEHVVQHSLCQRRVRPGRLAGSFGGAVILSR